MIIVNIIIIIVIFFITSIWLKNHLPHICIFQSRLSSPTLSSSWSYSSWITYSGQNLLFDWATSYTGWGRGGTSEALAHQPNQTKTIFLVRLRCSNRKLTRKLFHNRQTKLSGYSTSGRIKPSCYSSLLFRRLFHSALNINVATQRMGNGNTVLHTIPQQPPKTITLSSGSVA